jgi:hypothetical protein
MWEALAVTLFSTKKERQEWRRFIEKVRADRERVFREDLILNSNTLYERRENI